MFRNRAGRVVLRPRRSLAQPLKGSLPVAFFKSISDRSSGLSLSSRVDRRATAGRFHVKHPATEGLPFSPTARVVAPSSRSVHMDRTYLVARLRLRRTEGWPLGSILRCWETYAWVGWRYPGEAEAIRAKQCAHHAAGTSLTSVSVKNRLTNSRRPRPVGQ